MTTNTIATSANWAKKLIPDKVYSPGNPACANNQFGYRDCVNQTDMTVFWKCLPTARVSCNEDPALGTYICQGQCCGWITVPGASGPDWICDANSSCSYTLGKCPTP